MRVMVRVRVRVRRKDEGDEERERQRKMLIDNKLRMSHLHILISSSPIVFS